MENATYSNLRYLTKNNAKRIIPDILFNDEYKSEDIYKTPIFFLSKKEEKILLGFKAFLINAQNFLENYYHPADISDKYKYLFEYNIPAYHTKSSCVRLHSDFVNILIPKEIRDKGHEEVIRFRKWFIKNLNERGGESRRQIKDDPIFRQRLFAEFGITYDKINDVQYDNSGLEIFNNLSLSDLESRIDTIIRESKFFFVSSTSVEQQVIKRFQKVASLGYLADEIKNNDTGLSDDVLKAFLRSYDIKFRKPLKLLLLEYYRVKYNPELKFEATTLDQLNFRQCNACDI